MKRKETIGYISTRRLHDYLEHPFKVEQDMELFELMRSIENEGVLVPLVVRPNPHGEDYEIISGHRRKAACEWAGIKEVPVVIREMTDDEAVLAMVDSNLQREHIKPSEKAFAYKMKLEAMKHQGKKMGKETSGQLGQKSMGTMSRQILAKQVGESERQIQRYIRLTNLIPKILTMVDEEKIAFSIGVELSYLSEEEQYELYAVMDIEQCTPSLSQAYRLKRKSKEGTLNMDVMYMILGEEKPNQREVIRIKASTINKYFPKEYTPKQKVELIEKLVKEWSRK